MPLLVQPAKETDLDDAVDVYISAFGTTSTVHKIMYPNGDTEHVKRSVKKAFREHLENPIASFYKVVDTDNNNRMAAWIDWKTLTQDEEAKSDVAVAVSSAEKDKTLQEEPSHPDVNAEFVRTFFSGFDELKRLYIKGKARVHIRLLATHADYFRRGCGKMLLDECATHADDLHLPTTLEASPLGVKLYLREGFEQIDGAVVSLDLKPYGYDKVSESVLMRRRVIGGGDGGI